MGESEKLVKALFDLARQNKPAVIFLDEIDSVMSARGENNNDATRRLKIEFLVQMLGVGKDDDGILVLGATNIPWRLDPAVRRRFQKKIYISLPKQEARKVMFKLNISNTPNTITEDEYENLASKSESYSRSDIANLTQKAVYSPVRKYQVAEYFKKVYQGNDFTYQIAHPNEPGAIPMKIQDLDASEKLVSPEVCYEDYVETIKRIKANVNVADLQKQEDFTNEFGQEGLEEN